MSHHDIIIETFAAIGAPARILARFPLASRYLWNGFMSPWPSNEYARMRQGNRFRWKIWLLFDIQELERLETLINKESDGSIWSFHQAQLSAFQMVAIIGTLIVQAAISALQLPLLAQAHYTARGFLTVSLVLSILAVLFTCLQQRIYGFAQSPSAIRAWLSNGVFCMNADGQHVMQSSLVSYHFLQAPFELLCISITLFLGAVGVYLGSALDGKLPLSSDLVHEGNRGVLIAFVMGTSFALSLLGQLLGRKDVEQKWWMKSVMERQSGADPLAGNDVELSKMSANTNNAQRFRRSTSHHPASGALQHSGSQSAGELLEALEEAAEAHRRCAQAEDNIVEWHRRQDTG